MHKGLSTIPGNSYYRQSWQRGKALCHKRTSISWTLHKSLPPQRLWPRRIVAMLLTLL
jgi:hypothetical protein